MPKRPPPLSPKTLVVSKTASRDIDQQLAYLARTASIDVALQFADAIDAELSKLAWLGHSGVNRDWISAGLRMTVLGQHSIYFRVTDTETRIVRFLRGAQDIERQSFSDDDY